MEKRGFFSLGFIVNKNELNKQWKERCDKDFDNIIISDQIAEYNFESFDDNGKKTDALLTAPLSIFKTTDDNEDEAKRIYAGAYYDAEISSLKNNPHYLVYYGTREELIDRIKNPGTEFKDKKIKSRLFKFAYIDKFNNILQDLADMAQPENWGENNNILQSYFIYTFHKQESDNHIAYSEDKYFAAFNTGLFDKAYQSIIALFTKNQKSDESPYTFKSFCILGAKGDGKILSNNFRIEDLKRAEYFSNPEDLYFKYNSMYTLAYDHILIERVSRLPLDFIQKYNFNKNQEINDLIEKIKTAADYSETNDLYKELGNAIAEDADLKYELKAQLDASVKLTCNEKIQQNYKLAVPSYYPTKETMGFLMPLSLSEKFGKPDVALVMTATDQGHYQGQTILTMDMAYIDARLIARPDSEWLRVDA